MPNPMMRRFVRVRLLKLLGEKTFCKTTEEFGTSPGGLWITNEDGGFKGRDIYDNSKGEVHPEVQMVLDACGWFIEPYDAGTLMIWPK